MFEILGMSTSDEIIDLAAANRLFHPDDDNLLSIVEHLHDRNESTIDRMFRMRHTDGQWVWLRARAELIGGSRPHVIGIAVDTSEQIRLAEQNRTADIRLRDAIENISEAFVLWDADNKLVMCNSKYQELYGLPNSAIERGSNL